MATYCARLTVQAGWSIPNLGPTVAEWTSPTECVMAVEGAARPAFEAVPGVVSVANLTIAQAKAVVTDNPLAGLSWVA